jgi:hypothetical protein
VLKKRVVGAAINPLATNGGVHDDGRDGDLVSRGEASKPSFSQKRGEVAIFRAHLQQFSVSDQLDQISSFFPWPGPISCPAFSSCCA